MESTSDAATISRATLNVTGATAQDRVYDGTTDATISGVTLDGVFGSDVVDLTNATAGSFADKNAGNYTWNVTAQTTANIIAADSEEPVRTLPLTLDGILPEMVTGVQQQISPANDLLLVNHGIRLPDGLSDHEAAGR